MSYLDLLPRDILSLISEFVEGQAKVDARKDLWKARYLESFRTRGLLLDELSLVIWHLQYPACSRCSIHISHLARAGRGWYRRSCHCGPMTSLMTLNNEFHDCAPPTFHFFPEWYKNVLWRYRELHPHFRNVLGGDNGSKDDESRSNHSGSPCQTGSCCRKSQGGSQQAQCRRNSSHN